MKSKIAIALTVPAMALALVASAPAFAEDAAKPASQPMQAGASATAPEVMPEEAKPASQSMHQAGEAVEQAGTSAATAVKDAYTGTKTAMKDTTVTAKVKRALHKDSSIGEAKIHVETVAGVVTLSGAVPTIAVAQRAQELAQQTSGVKSVNNQLAVASLQSSVQ
ncbi:MAG TPA: BON domain-containing protein [Candidatus Acidoferrales bacterium]|nr:BON domain-containing protein [Candidatus Acidoferrales bacterium]